MIVRWKIDVQDLQCPQCSRRADIRLNRSLRAVAFCVCLVAANTVFFRVCHSSLNAVQALSRTERELRKIHIRMVSCTLRDEEGFGECRRSRSVDGVSRSLPAGRKVSLPTFHAYDTCC